MKRFLIGCLAALAAAVAQAEDPLAGFVKAEVSESVAVRMEARTNATVVARVMPVAVVKFGEGTGIKVEAGGTVDFAGTQNSRVVLTHFADDAFGGDSDFGATSRIIRSPRRNPPRSWQSIRLNSSASIEHSNNSPCRRSSRRMPLL